MKKKILALAIAGALACPQVAFAARDGDGMEYVSASEGFYGSIRTMFTTRPDGDAANGSKITGDTSRLGVRGTLDVGHGLTGVYRYEWFIGPDNGADNSLKTRLHYVGLKGAFGEVQAGALWGNGYNWVTSGTDVATSGGGNFAPRFRSNNSIQYTSPDLNGFQGSFRVAMNGGTETRNSAEDGTTGNVTATGENVDEWALHAKYGVRGFTIAGMYETHPGAANKKPPIAASGSVANPAGVSVDKAEGVATDPVAASEDVTFWALRGGYSQDNWAVNAWYGVRNDSDWTNGDDQTTFSVSGNIDVGKVGLVVIHENQERNRVGMGSGRGDNAANRAISQVDDSATIFNVNYHFTKKSRVYLAYIARDYDGAVKGKDNSDDEVRIGLRMDF